MTKTNLTLAMLLAATSGGLIYMSADQGKTVEQVAVVAEDAKIDGVMTADVSAEIKEVIAKVAQPGEDIACAKCETGLWDGEKRVLTEGWCCNGAFMPRAVADELDAAVARMAIEAAVEEEIIP